VRFVLSAIMMFYGLGFNELNSFNKFSDRFINGFFLPQQEPFYFQKPVPATVKLRGKIDLSFFRNQPIVSQYRFKLVLPEGGETLIESSLTKWSAWISFNYIEILIPVLDLEGGYKLIFEYRSSKNNEISKFEKPFYVYRANIIQGAVVAESKAAPAIDKSIAKADPEAGKKPAKAAPITDKATVKAPPVTDKATSNTLSATTKLSTPTKSTPADIIVIEKVTLNEKQIVLVNSETKGTDVFKTTPQAGNKNAEPSLGPGSSEKLKSMDFNKLLEEAIEKKDAVLFRKSIQNGAGSEIRGADGGNIFHLIDNSIADEETITMLVINGISINEKDNYGNSPLHSAILSGDNEYVRILLISGANLNSRNTLELTPLHLAAFLNNENVVNQLLLKGAEIDIKGNSGYTPLHIAAEMNYIALAKDLFYMGANRRVKTDQKLTPKAIAKIQGNEEMVRLISKKGSYSVTIPNPPATNSTALSNSTQLSPRYDFKLPYDQELAKKRQFNKVMQTISIPIFALSTAGLTYFKSEANNYFSLSKIAETEEMAKDLYDKGNHYNTYSYISGGISLVSIYEFIHSSIRKKNISNNMRKKLN